MDQNERLTIYNNKYGICYFSKYHFDKNKEEYIVPADRMHKGEIQDVLQRLSFYEDTGLTPKEVEEMKKEKEEK